MDCHLIFDAQQDVGGVLVTVGFEDISIPRELCLPFGISDDFAEQSVCGFQTIRLDDLFAVVDIGVEQVCKDFWFGHEDV